jgi:hypothetical protein
MLYMHGTNESFVWLSHSSMNLLCCFGWCNSGNRLRHTFQELTKGTNSTVTKPLFTVCVTQFFFLSLPPVFIGLPIH